jgi:hypothetical protein
VTVDASGGGALYEVTGRSGAGEPGGAAPAGPDGPKRAEGDLGLEPGDGARGGPWSGRFWSVGFPFLTILLALSVPVLLVTGRNVVLHTAGGTLESQAADPAAPGWQAWTEPTPVALVLQRDGGGGLVAATVVSLTGRDAAAVVLVPVGTVVGGAGNGRTLAGLGADGEEGARTGVEQLLGVAPTDVVTLDPDGWARTVTPAGTLDVKNPDDVFVAAGDRPGLRFAKGDLRLAPGDVADFLALRNTGELDLNRLVRHEALWRAWVSAVARGGAAAQPPDPLARYLAALAAARIDVSTLPVQVEPGGDGTDRFTPVPDQVRTLVARVTPYPVGSDGRRLRIRLLDGVGTLQHGVPAAGRLVGRGGQIDQIGNAASFGVPRTKLEFADDRRRSEVEALAAALGVGEVVKATDIDGSLDVVVTLGQDYADGPGRAGG